MARCEGDMVVALRIHIDLTHSLQVDAFADHLASNAEILHEHDSSGEAPTFCVSVENSRRKLVLRKDTTSVV